VNDTRFRIPDIILVEKPFDRKARFYADVPLAVIEILSPDDKMKESLHRFGDYARMGVPHIIQMDPDDRTTRVYRSGDLIATELTTLTFPGGRSIEFNSRELLAELEEEV
jgi:Uma2 family endonuclease